MSKIKIFADSTSDLSKNLIENNQISIVPLYVGFDDESYKDGVQITTKDLYTKVAEYDKLPKTSAPSPLDFVNAFKPFVEEGRDILYIGISSKLSSTLQNAKIAASEFPNAKIEIVDSFNLSTGIGLLVMKAVDFANEGMGVEDIAAKLRELAPNVETAFVPDTLDYLYKGGRCSATQALMGSVLKIRPIIKVVDGGMIVGQKARGKREKILETMLENALKDKDSMDKKRVFVTHTEGLEDANFLKEQLEKELDVEEVIITDAGCVISSHCGPNTVGILYILNEKI
ncbi:EDD domain protein, DegV family [Proteiniborus ethanoligenes]|uniref:EDD domain protein, DegV family n=1 Tax=Proteiniborus ethanoligenes TaxID=415015 RepID=A0A1H3P8L5_9FIRM|nr:DegV family protein [Proteiniborus ethanoligenes]SDY97273.1 EDD domain protein, DegV family [Proteiniborus ethanoligenes]